MKSRDILFGSRAILKYDPDPDDLEYLFLLGRAARAKMVHRRAKIINRSVKNRCFGFLDMSGSVIEDSHFSDCFFSARDSAFSAILDQSSISGTSFDHVVFSDCSFQGVELSKSVFRNSDLSRVNFSGSSFKDSVDFFKCSFSGNVFSDLSMSQATNFKHSVFKSVTFLDFFSAGAATFSNSSFFKVSSYMALFQGSCFDRVVIEQSDFPAAKLVDVSAESIQIIDSNFKEVDFRGADLNGAVFENSNLSFANFKGANLDRARFNNCNLDQVSFPDNKGLFLIK